MEQFLLIVIPGFVFWYICKSTPKETIRVNDESHRSLPVSEKNTQIKLILPFLFSGLQFFFVSTICLVLINKFAFQLDIQSSLKNSVQDLFLINLFLATALAAAGGDYFKNAGNDCFNAFAIGYLLPKHQNELTDLYTKLTEMDYLIITLNSRKVYYAVIASCEGGDSLQDSYLEFYPFASGYRDDFGQVVLTDDYAEYIKKDFKSSTIIRYGEIQSIVKYDHEHFNYKDNFRKKPYMNDQLESYLNRN